MFLYQFGIIDVSLNAHACPFTALVRVRSPNPRSDLISFSLNLFLSTFFGGTRIFLCLSRFLSRSRIVVVLRFNQHHLNDQQKELLM